MVDTLLQVWIRTLREVNRSGVIKLQITKKLQEKRLHHKNRQNQWDVISPDWKKMQLSDMSYTMTSSKCLIPTDKTKYSKWTQNDIQMKETENLRTTQ